jgi:hypothetical protein
LLTGEEGLRHRMLTQQGESPFGLTAAGA